MRVDCQVKVQQDGKVVRDFFLEGWGENPQRGEEIAIIDGQHYVVVRRVFVSGGIVSVGGVDSIHCSHIVLFVEAVA